MPNVHIAAKADLETLLQQPELILQKLSMKIWEKRAFALDNLIGKKIRYKTSGTLRSGICESYNDNICNVRDGDKLVKVNLKKIVLQ